MSIRQLVNVCMKILNHSDNVDIPAIAYGQTATFRHEVSKVHISRIVQIETYVFFFLKMILQIKRIGTEVKESVAVFHMY